MALALALTVSPLAADHHKEQTNFHKASEVASLIDRVESNALDIREQAARLRTYNRTPQLYSWELHADELNRVRAELDRMATLIQDLEPLKSGMTLRQDAAFNRIVSLSAEMSDATAKAIEIVNTEKEKLEVGHPDYEQQVDAIYDKADTVISNAETVEDWAELIEKIQEPSE
ncbi:MAG: hypothetical protein R2748_04860 [Bryobacterales bacterium]